MSQYTEEIITQEQFIKFLQNGIKYIYFPDDIHNNKYWINVNTKHMEFIMSGYNNELQGCDYSIIIQINGEIKYVSNDYKRIISYFRENIEEYTNNIYKLVYIKYNFET